MQDSAESNSSVRNFCILVVNFHSAQNAGDLALLEMNLRQLRASFEKPSFIVTANHPDESVLKQIPGIRVVPSAFALSGANQGAPVYQQILRLLGGMLKAVSSRYFGRGVKDPLPGSGWDGLIAAFRRADLVVGVSGNYFLSMGRFGWPFPLTAFPVWAAWLFRKPFYAMPQSIGPFRRKWEKIIFKWLYSRARQIYLRDQVSLDLAKELGLPERRVQFAPDPAFALPMASREEALQILTKYGYQPAQKAVGITVIAPLTRALSMQMMEQYYRDLAATLARFTQQYNINVYIFNQVTGPTPREDDRTAGRMLLKLLPADQNRVVLVDEVLSPELLKACYSCMNLMIASRLHSGIFAMGAGVATLSIGYFTKSRGLMQAMGLENWLIELGEADAEKMWQKICEAWSQQDETAAVVQKKASAYAEETLHLADKIREDYDLTRPRLKIAQLVKGLDIGGYNGGSDVFGVNLVIALKDAGADARLVVFFQMETGTEKQFASQLAAHGVDVVFLQPWHGRASFRSYLEGFKKLSVYLKTESIDLLHSHFQIGSLMAAWFRLFGRVSRTARTIHVDREWLRGWEGPVQQILIRSFIFVVFPLLIDLECGVSQESVSVVNSRWLARLLGKKACIVPNSIPTPDFSKLQEVARSADQPKMSGRFLIGTVGRMTEQKGHEFLLEAIPAVLQAVPEARFVWIGDGPLRSKLEEKAVQLGVHDAIEFTGIRSDVAALLDELDLFVLPSIYEGLPTVILESMAHGVPVIGTDIPGTREIIRHQENGWLIPPRSSQSLADMILYTVRAPGERVQMAQAALNSIKEFTIECAAEKYLALYQSLYR